MSPCSVLFLYFVEVRWPNNTRVLRVQIGHKSSDWASPLASLIGKVQQSPNPICLSCLWDLQHAKCKKVFCLSTFCCCRPLLYHLHWLYPSLSWCPHDIAISHQSQNCLQQPSMLHHICIKVIIGENKCRMTLGLSASAAFLIEWHDEPRGETFVLLPKQQLLLEPIHQQLKVSDHLVGL